MSRNTASRRHALQLLAIGASLSLSACRSILGIRAEAQNESALTQVPTPSSSPSPEPTATDTATPEPTRTPKPTADASVTPTSQITLEPPTSTISPTPLPQLPPRPALVKGLHVPYAFLKSPIDYGRLENVLARTAANAVVIDIKSEGGLVAIPFEHPMRSAYLNERGFGYDGVLNLVGWLRQRGIYPVARQVIMSDTLLLNEQPQLALHYSGKRYVDVNGELWADPTRTEIAEYNAAIASAAAQVGFSEIQLDYVRYPESDFSKSIESRVSAIANIASHIRTELNLRAYLTLDVLGDSTVDYPRDYSDAGVGQHIATLATVADGICPMLYPDLRGENIDVNYYQTVYDATVRAIQRVSIASTAFVNPWIQAYYAAGRDRIIEQKQAAFDAGAVGVFAWNRDLDYPSGIY